MKQSTWIYIALAAVAFFFFGEQLRAMILARMPDTLKAAAGETASTTGRKSYLGQKGMPPSYRNNNPGNLRVTSSQWKGALSIHPENTDKRFVVFEDWIFGTRAMIKNLQGYFIKHGIKSIDGIVNRWAPSSDGNDTSSYAAAIVNATGFDPSEEITWNRENAMGIVRAMADVESGIKDSVTVNDFNTAWAEL